VLSKKKNKSKRERGQPEGFRGRGKTDEGGLFTVVNRRREEENRKTFIQGLGKGRIVRRVLGHLRKSI